MALPPTILVASASDAPLTTDYLPSPNAASDDSHIDDAADRAFEDFLTGFNEQDIKRAYSWWRQDERATVYKTRKPFNTTLAAFESRLDTLQNPTTIRDNRSAPEQDEQIEADIDRLKTYVSILRDKGWATKTKTSDSLLGGRILAETLRLHLPVTCEDVSKQWLDDVVQGLKDGTLRASLLVDGIQRSDMEADLRELYRDLRSVLDKLSESMEGSSTRGELVAQATDVRLYLEQLRKLGTAYEPSLFPGDTAADESALRPRTQLDDGRSSPPGDNPFLKPRPTQPPKRTRPESSS